LKINSKAAVMPAEKMPVVIRMITVHRRIFSVYAVMSGTGAGGCDATAMLPLPFLQAPR
jgi:hypothetical protein